MVLSQSCARCGALRHTSVGVCPACGHDQIVRTTDAAPRRLEPTTSPSRCPRCGGDCDWADEICRDCGRRVYTACRSCGAPNLAGHRHCVYCGVRGGGASLSFTSLQRPFRRFSSASTAFSKGRATWSSAKEALDVFGSDWFILPSPKAQRFAEIGLVSLLTLLALLIRVWDIGDVPPAGDESGVALETIRLLNGEWIGIWSGVALGNPTGHLFWIAPFFWFGGPTLTMLRLSSVLPGVLMVPICYLMIRMLFPFPVAFVSASLFAFFSWFVIVYRIGFPITLSMFVAATSLCLAVYSVRSSRRWVAVLAGVVLGTGLYVFKGFVIYFVAIWGATILILIFSRRLRQMWALYLFIGVSAVVGAVIIEFYATTGYLGQNLESYYRVSSGDLLSLSSHMRRLAEVVLFVHFPPESGAFAVDGIIPKPLLHPALAVFFWVGLLITLLFINRTPYQLLLLGWLIGMAPAILVPGGETRRYLLGVFFVLVITAVGFTAVVQLACNRWLGPRNGLDTRLLGISKSWLGYSLAALVAMAFICVFTIQNLSAFNDWPKSRETRFQFDPEIARAARYMETIDDGYTVEFYSVRWALDYETVRWFAPSARGSNGSDEFGGDGTIFSGGVVSEPTVFMLLGGYLDLIGSLRETYPDGREYLEVDEDGKLLFIAYRIDDPPPQGTVAAPPYFRLFPDPETIDVRVGVPITFRIETHEPTAVRVVVHPSTGDSANLAFVGGSCQGDSESSLLVTDDQPVSIMACKPGAAEILLYIERDRSIVNRYSFNVIANQIENTNLPMNEKVAIVPDPGDLEIRASAYKHYALQLVAARSLLIVPSPADSVVIHNNPDLQGSNGCTEVPKRPEGDTRLSLILPDDGVETSSLFYMVACAPGAAVLEVVSNDLVVATYTFTITDP